VRPRGPAARRREPALRDFSTFLAGVETFVVEELPIDIDPAAGDRVRVAVAGGGVVLLGESHGVEQNPLIIATLVRTFGLCSLGLEWDVELQPVVDDFLAGRPLDVAALAPSVDGRITAGHFAVLRSLRERGLLERAVLFDPPWPGSWDERDRLMAAELLAGIGSGPALAVAGNLHTWLRPHEHGVPMGVHVAAARPATLEIRIRCLSGEALNITLKRVGSPVAETGHHHAAALREAGHRLELTLPVARPAIVPGP
jgi:hypothetical protein